jgi:hypothetical protein
MFADTNMDQLRNLPLYANGAEDLPPETLAVVGYALNTFTYNGSAHPGALAVSFNILFVIALGEVDRPLVEHISADMV